MPITIETDNQLAARSRVLGALADPTRARVVELLAQGPRTATDLHRAFPIAAPAVSRHLRVLREAGLIEEDRPAEDRRVRVYRLRPEPLAEVAAWLEGVGRGWQAQLDSFKSYVALRRRG